MPYFRPKIQIAAAISDHQIEQVRRLFVEYQKELGIDLCFQNFTAEVANLPGDYALPDGRLKLAIASGEPAGCVALRKIAPGVCEMKRLYVRAQFRSAGLGSKLAKLMIREARLYGYQHMRLDTLPGKMDRAIELYRSLGFKEIAPYYHNPVPGALFLELDLSNADW
jgi:putative acetyltransferase